MEKKVNVILDKKDFIDWRFNCNDDFIGLAEDVIDAIKDEGKVSMTLKEIAQNTGYIPLTFVLNKNELPDNILDEDKVEIEAVNLCDFSFK